MGHRKRNERVEYNEAEHAFAMKKIASAKVVYVLVERWTETGTAMLVKWQGGVLAATSRRGAYILRNNMRRIEEIKEIQLDGLKARGSPITMVYVNASQGIYWKVVNIGDGGTGESIEGDAGESRRPETFFPQENLDDMGDRPNEVQPSDVEQHNASPDNKLPTDDAGRGVQDGEFTPLQSKDAVKRPGSERPGEV